MKPFIPKEHSRFLIFQGSAISVSEENYKGSSSSSIAAITACETTKPKFWAVYDTVTKVFIATTGLEEPTNDNQEAKQDSKASKSKGTKTKMA